MKQVIRRGLKEIIVDEVPDPVVTSQHVLIRPVCSLISSSGTQTAYIHQEGALNGVAGNPSQMHKVWEVMKAAGPTRKLVEVTVRDGAQAADGGLRMLESPRSLLPCRIDLDRSLGGSKLS